MDGGERLQHQIVPGTQMGPLVCHDRGDLVVPQGAQRPLTDDHPAAYARQTVGQRLIDFQNA
ncbi:Uncharacterised protein [Mycobacteroides abscessus subsp. abscessus]|nr:Uncharacterised protein [Mycobacteroides abscessus subsp. abscessus]